MLEQKDKNHLLAFGKRLLSLTSKFSIGTYILTPTNYSQEKDNFLKSDTYNPQFTYEPHDTSILKRELSSLRDELKSIHVPADIHFHLLAQIRSISLDIEFIDAIGTPKFATTSDTIFRFGDIDGKEFLREIPTISFSEPNTCVLKNAEEMAVIFKKYLNDIGLEYSVLIDHQNDHIVRVGPNKLIIGSKVKRFCNNVQRLMVHEIESHILQRFNQVNAQNPLLRLIPHADSLLWGEGLAVYNEINSGTITRSAYETYYYRVKAVEMLHKSFREIFDYLSNYVSSEKAYMITYRVKRGMGNTSLPGGYAKDASYLLGYKTVKTYIESGGDVEFLYVSRSPALGELLYDQGLLTHSSILLPAYLQKSSSAKKIPVSPPNFGVSFLRQ